MKGLLITPGNTMRTVELHSPLHESIRAATGGWMEIVHPVHLPAPYCMIVDEEGLLKELSFNKVGSYLYGTGEHGIPIVGPIVIMKHGIVNGEPDIVGLTDEEIDTFSQEWQLLFQLILEPEGESNMPPIPDHPAIRNAELSGYPDGKVPAVPICPVCGAECEEVYESNTGGIVGCDHCLTLHDAYDREECFPGEEQ